jgi:hypothetical protein
MVERKIMRMLKNIYGLINKRVPEPKSIDVDKVLSVIDTDGTIEWKDMALSGSMVVVDTFDDLPSVGISNKVLFYVRDTDSLYVTEDGGETYIRPFADSVQSDWDEEDDTESDFIKNKPENLVQDPNYVHTDNNYTDNDVTKLGDIEDGAEVNVNADWDATSGDAQILNKPTIPAAQIQSDWGEDDDTEVDYINNKPSIPDLPDGPIGDDGNYILVKTTISGEDVYTWEVNTVDGTKYLGSVATHADIPTTHAELIGLWSNANNNDYFIVQVDEDEDDKTAYYNITNAGVEDEDPVIVALMYVIEGDVLPDEKYVRELEVDPGTVVDGLTDEVTITKFRKNLKTNNESSHITKLKAGTDITLGIGGTTSNPEVTINSLNTNFYGEVDFIQDTVANLPDKPDNTLAFVEADNKIYECNSNDWTAITDSLTHNDYKFINKEDSTLHIYNDSDWDVFSGGNEPDGETIELNGSEKLSVKISGHSHNVLQKITDGLFVDDNIRSTDIYLNSDDGDDDNSGLDNDHPWKTMDRFDTWLITEKYNSGFVIVHLAGNLAFESAILDNIFSVKFINDSEDDVTINMNSTDLFKLRNAYNVSFHNITYFNEDGLMGIPVFKIYESQNIQYENCTFLTDTDDTIWFLTDNSEITFEGLTVEGHGGESMFIIANRPSVIKIDNTIKMDNIKYVCDGAMSLYYINHIIPGNSTMAPADAAEYNLVINPTLTVGVYEKPHIIGQQFDPDDSAYIVNMITDRVLPPQWKFTVQNTTTGDYYFITSELD